MEVKYFTDNLVVISETELKGLQGSVDYHEVGKLEIIHFVAAKFDRNILKCGSKDERREIRTFLSQPMKITSNQDTMIKVLQSKNDTVEKKCK